MKKISSFIFVLITMILLVSIAVGAPTLYFQSIEDEPGANAVGNMPQEKRSFTGFGADLFSWLDELRYNIDYVFLNYIPFSIDTIKNGNNVINYINNPFERILKMVLSEETADFFDMETSSVKTKRKAEYLSVPSGARISRYSIDCIKNTDEYRYYQVELFLDSGEKVEFYEKINIGQYDALRKTMLRQVNEINRIANAEPGINFVVYIPTDFQTSENFNDYYNTYGEQSLYPLLTEYLGELDDSITHGYLKLENLADRANFGYLTDHHWSAEGVYQGYTDITELFRQNSDAVLPAKTEPQKTVEVTPCQFFGSYAREIAADRLWDPFVIYDYELPEHTAFHSGSQPYFVSERIDILSQCNINSLNSNAYGTFYPQVTYVQYPENKTGRNLLILGDSYTRSITELLASSFDNTYALYYCEYSYINVDYDQFVKEHNITDVLYMQYSERALFDYCNDSNLNYIITQN